MGRCGWCESESKCMPGGAAGPHRANCSAWDFAFCSNLPCTEHTSCNTCSSDPMCGWCSSSNICTEGNPRGPVFMTCLAKDWLAEPEMKPVPPQPEPEKVYASYPMPKSEDINQHDG